MLGRAARDTLIYGAAGVAARGTSIALVPLYTRALTPEQLGLVELLLVVALVAHVTVAFEIGQALARYLPDTVDETERRRLSRAALGFTSLAYGVFLVLGIILAEQIAPALAGRPEHASVVRVAAVWITVHGIFLLVANQLRYELRPAGYAAVTLLYSIVSVLAAIVLVGVAGLGPEGVFTAQLAGSALGLVVGLGLARASFRDRFDWRVVRHMLGFSVPLVPGALGVVISLYVDRIVVAQLLTVEELGIFAVGARLASAASLLVAAMQLALTPLIYARYREPETPRDLATALRWFWAGGICISLLMALFGAGLIGFLATPRYVAAAGVLALLTPAVLLAGTYVFAPGLGIARRTAATAAIHIGAAVLNLVLNLALVPILGIVGAAAATLTSSAVLFAAYLWASQRFYPVPHDVTKLALGALGAIGLYVVSAQVPDSAPAGPLVRVAALLLAFALCVVLGLVRAEELRAAFERLSGLRRMRVAS